MPFFAFLLIAALILIYFLNEKIVPGFSVIILFILVVFFSIFFAAFSGTILKSVWRCCKLPQYGFITGRIKQIIMLL